MNTTEVEALVRSVIVHFGLPFTVVSVVGSAAGWNIQVRSGGTARIVSFAVAGRGALAIRIAVQERLEAEL